ncbi:MAG: histidine kinase N-terminal 7TM domain-containing protein [Patescibacteria group bacterium]
MNFLYLLNLLAVLVNLGLGIFVYFNGRKKKVNRAYLFLSLAISGWVFTNLLTYYLVDYNAIAISGKFDYAFAALLVPLFFTFAIYFPNEKFHIKTKLLHIGLIVSWVSGILVIIASLFTKYIQVRPIVITPHVVTIEQGSGHPYFFAYYILFVAWAFAILIQKIKRTTGIDKQKITIVVYGFAVAGIFGTTGNLVLTTFLHSLTGQAIASLIGPIFTVALVASMAYAILKYRLLDIQFAIQRGIARLLTFGIIFGFFAYLLLFIERNVEATSERNVSLLIVVVVLVLTVEPLRRWIYRFVDSLFDNQERKRRDALQRIQLVASSTLKFTSLVERLTSELHNVFGVDVHFLLRDEQHGKLAGVAELSLKDPIAGQIVDGKVIITDELPYRIENGEAMLAPLHTWLQSNKISAVLPIGNREDFVGAFIFHDGQGSVPFTTDRVEFLKRFRNQVQFAFASAYAYKLAIERISA